MDRQTDRLYWRQPGTQRHIGWSISRFFPIFLRGKRHAIEHNLRRKKEYFQSMISKFILFRHS